MEAPNPLEEFFAGRCAGEQARHLPGVDFGLIHSIVEQKPSATVDSLIAFCRDPRNLRDLLPDPRDRTLFSRRLVRALMEYRSRGSPRPAARVRPAVDLR